jgi:hypothetical protein
MMQDCHIEARQRKYIDACVFEANVFLSFLFSSIPKCVEPTCVASSILMYTAAALSHPIWYGELHTMRLDSEIGLVSEKEMAVLYRNIVCTDTDVENHDELRIYESKWHSVHSRLVPIVSGATCRRMMYAPDDSKLPPSGCVMKLESGGESVVFSVKGDLLLKLQHT